MSYKSNEIAQWQQEDQVFVWHPFTQMKEWEVETPTIIVKGDGVRLTDITGRTYLDGTSSIWVNIHGHNHPDLNQALINQIQKISHSTLLGLASLPSIALAKRLIQIAPTSEETPHKLTKVFYSDNGSTAVEIALKMAFVFWQYQEKKHRKKKKFIAFTNAYHGDTLGAVGVGGIDLFHQTYDSLLFDTIKAPAPTCYRCPLGLEHPSCALACVDEVEILLKTHHKKLAGLIIEPLIQAAAGMFAAPPGYLKKIRTLCTQYEVLMIADEVAVGFGRTGKMFACEHENVVPDLMALSKGITGGYLPLAATLTTQEIYDAFLGEYDEFKTFFHGHSYTGNALGCAAAIANLDIFEKEKTLEKLQPKIQFAANYIKPWRRWKYVGDIRQVGFVIAIELVADKTNKTPFPLEKRIGTLVCREAQSLGLLLRPLGNVIFLMPPLSTSMKDLEEMLSITGASIKKITSRMKS
ncbi:Adenosylmethionine-8-amino-7-oxononanoate aminotransferase [hydrothermal vent metagenome]|uniref:Adenosylmethionine-8-amino-7-oxononanoate aminotransferase n=1 Tax=hydrothermal vent metagenome TaxID=652676 RepID=A0A3B1CCA9_9ZZZZ